MPTPRTTIAAALVLTAPLQLAQADTAPSKPNLVGRKMGREYDDESGHHYRGYHYGWRKYHRDWRDDD